MGPLSATGRTDKHERPTQLAATSARWRPVLTRIYEIDWYSSTLVVDMDLLAGRQED